MATNLVIVESPAKARTIKKYLGKDFDVLACYGHVRDLVPKSGAVDPEHNFAMRYQPIEKNAKFSQFNTRQSEIAVVRRLFKMGLKSVQRRLKTVRRLFHPLLVAVCAMLKNCARSAKNVLIFFKEK